MAEVGSFGVGNRAIRWTSVYKMIRGWGVNFELPRGLQNPERLQRACVPAFRALVRNLGVADEHWDVVGPRRHLTGDLRSCDRDVRNGNSIGAIFSEIGDRGVEYALKISTELLFALGSPRGRKKENDEAEKRKCAKQFHLHRQ